jgi:hypothetical protein
MDHDEALRMMATERYLLDEFTPELKEAFEEHFFSCQDCALDVRMAAALVEHVPPWVNSAESVEKVTTAVPQKPGWFGWLRPAITVPAMAVLLAVIGVQYLVVRPRFEATIARLEQPQVLGSAYLSSGDTRGTRPIITARPGTPSVLFIDVPGAGDADSYAAELYSPAGVREWSLQISPETVAAAHGTLSISVSLAHEQPGTYVLVLRKSESNGAEGPEIGRYSFELQLR